MESETSNRTDENVTSEKHFNIQKKGTDVSGNETIPVPNVDATAVLDEKEYDAMWQKELDGDTYGEFVKMSKHDYFAFCTNFHKSLQSLLAEEMTSAYANFLVLFKKFRFTYGHNVKLLAKVHELETLKRFLESSNEDLLKKLDKSETQAKELRISNMTMRNVITETVQQKNEIQKQRDELKQKLSLIPEEIVEAAGQTSESAAPEEKKHLNVLMVEMRDRIAFLKEDLERCQKREDLLRSKLQEAKKLQVAFREETEAVKTEIMYHIHMKENAELLVKEKAAKINSNLSTIKQLKTDITNLKEELKHEKNHHNRTLKDMEAFKKAFQDAEDTITQLKNEYSVRHFQITVLKQNKTNLEYEIKRNQAEIHALQLDNTKLSKERAQFARSARAFEEEMKKWRHDYGEISQEIKLVINERDQIVREKKHIEQDYKDSVRHVMKIDRQYRSTRKVIKDLRSKIKTLELNKRLAAKVLSTKVQQIQDLEHVIVKDRDEKNILVRDLKAVNITLEESQERVKELEHRYAEYDSKITHLTEQIQIEKDKYKYLYDMQSGITNQYKAAKRELKETKHFNIMVTKRNKDQIDRISVLQERHDKLEKQITALKIDVKTARSAQAVQEVRCSKLAEELENSETEKLVILRSMSGHEIELTALRREVKNVTSDREVVKLQLSERLNEIKAKEEEVRLKQQDLIKVEQLLHDRINDIKLLKAEVDDLRRREVILKNQTNDIENMRVEIYNIHCQLVDEKFRSKIMQEELKKPQNIHRWRILEAEDPARANLIEKNLKFQKDLIKKTDKLKIKEQELQDRSHQVTELKQDLQKLMEARAKGNTWSCKKQLQGCKERIKCLTAEVAMYNNLTSKQQIENEVLKKEINRLKVLAYDKKLVAVK